MLKMNLRSINVDILTFTNVQMPEMTESVAVRMPRRIYFAEVGERKYKTKFIIVT